MIGFTLGSHFFEPSSVSIYESSNKTQLQVCFTPQQQCLPMVLVEIRKAKQEILVQAYQITSKPIADALIEAHRRGVTVRVLADKSQETSSRSQIRCLAQAGIEVLIDAKPRIAHHKILILDQQTLLGGSYNYMSTLMSRIFLSSRIVLL
jgi:phosphatidylserine/phosphatidylglycerophosphate/cardiolipin synthase-like enzyme